MNRITAVLTGSTLRFSLVSVVIAGLFVFAVLPVLPNMTSGEGFSLQALTSFAQDSGDGDSGGDAGGGCGCDGGDSGGGDSGGGDGGGSDYPVPVCSLTMNRTSIVRGESATLAWDTNDASDVTISNGVGRVSVDGSRTVSPTADTTYTLTAQGLGGTSVTCTATVTVTTPPPPPVGECVLEITKSADKATASVGETITYTLNFRNTGTANCTGGGVRIVDDLPAGVDYLLAIPSANVIGGYGSLPLYDSVRHNVNLNADVLTPGESGSATIKVRVAQPAQCGNYGIENKGMITSAEYSNSTRWVESNTVRTTVSNECPQPAPICTVGVTPVAITSGQSANLSWSTTNATAVTFNQGIGSVPVNGNRSVSPATTTVYTATVTGPGGTVTCANTVTVTPVVIPRPVCTLDANPTSIVRGQTATLSWTTQNATNVSIAGGASSSEVASGSVIVSPTETRTYELIAVGTGGSVSCTRTITVREPDPVLSCDAFTANPGALTSAGTTTLTWATSNATAVSINNGVGSVGEDGSRDVYVSGNTTFTLTATRGSETRTCTVPVTVAPAAVVPRCDSFTVSDSSVRRGDAVSLVWETTNATSVTINQGVGSVSPDGARTVTVEGDTTYVLTAGSGTGTTSCQVSVNIESSGGGGGGGSSSPRCELTPSDKTVKSGEKVTLTWKNSRTDEILLEDERGNDLVDTRERDDDRTYDEDGDSYDVRPTKTTEYKLTVWNGSKKRTCTTEVTVENITVSSTRSNTPIVAGISLSRLPYTGFDAGPFLTAVFYTLLIVWAFVVAYFLVIRRESVLGVSLRAKTVKGANSIAYLPGPVEPSVVVPSMTTPRVTAPAVSRMEYVPSVLTPPRKLPHGDMASKHAPVGYEAYYEGYGETIPEPTFVPTDIANLPIGELEIPEATQATDDTELLENRAHDAHILISTDALNFIMAQSRMTNERIELLDMVIGAAKANFPKEDGWVVVNKERILTLLA